MGLVIEHGYKLERHIQCFRKLSTWGHRPITLNIGTGICRHIFAQKIKEKKERPSGGEVAKINEVSDSCPHRTK